MLYTKVVEPGTLDLLKKLMSLPGLNEFNLVGGTALALHYGHRNSIDLDLFGKVDFLNEELIDEDLRYFNNVVKTTRSRVMVGYNINGVKVDIVKYQYHLIDPIQTVENIRLASPRDIAAMKCAAISGRGKRKDFYDLYEILQRHSLDDILHFYNKKYQDGNEFIVLRSINYFADAEEDEDPELYKNQNWKDVKNYINQKLYEYLDKL